MTEMACSGPSSSSCDGSFSLCGSGSIKGDLLSLLGSFHFICLTLVTVAQLITWTNQCNQLAGYLITYIIYCHMQHNHTTLALL